MAKFFTDKHIEKKNHQIQTEKKNKNKNNKIDN